MVASSAAVAPVLTLADPVFWVYLVFGAGYIIASLAFAYTQIDRLQSNAATGTNQYTQKDLMVPDTRFTRAVATHKASVIATYLTSPVLLAITMAVWIALTLFMLAMFAWEGLQDIVMSIKSAR